MSDFDEVREIGSTAERIFAGWTPGNDGQKFAAGIWKRLDAAELSRLSVPAVCGGAGGSLVHSTEVIRQAARFAVPVPVGEHDALAGWCLSQAGMQLPAGIVTAVIGGDLVVEQLSHGVSVRGTMSSVAWGRYAEHVVVLCRAGSEPAVLLLPTRCVEICQGENIAGEPRDAMRVRPDTVLEATSLVIVDRCLDTEFRARGALVRAVAIAGAISGAASLVAAYAAEREQFGKPIASFQVIRHYLADLFTAAALAESASATAVREYCDDPTSIAPSLAKLVAAQSVRSVCELAHQIVGAMGFTIEHRLHRYTTRLWAWRSEFGAEPFHESVIGRYVATAASGDPWIEVCAR